MLQNREVTHLISFHILNEYFEGVYCVQCALQYNTCRLIIVVGTLLLAYNR